jgi:hypothetical protein
MATDPINIAGVRWPNYFQNKTGLVAGAANPTLDPTALNNAQQPLDTAKVKFQPTSVDTTPSTDSTKGRAIDTYA